MSDSPSLADTRQRLLDAAEVLFAEKGVDATSMRVITRAAACNLAAAHYHFGSKEALIEAVFRRGLSRLNEVRIEALERAEREAGGSPLKPHRIVESFFGTALEMAADREHGGYTFMRLLGRSLSHPSEFIRTFLATEYREVLERYKHALYAALPEVPRDEIVWRLHFMLGAMSYALAGSDSLRLLMDAPGDDDPRGMAPRLMAFLLGGLRAPLSQLDERAPKKAAAASSRSRRSAAVTPRGKPVKLPRPRGAAAEKD